MAPTTLCHGTLTALLCLKSGEIKRLLWTEKVTFASVIVQKQGGVKAKMFLAYFSIFLQVLAGSSKFMHILAYLAQISI